MRWPCALKGGRQGEQTYGVVKEMHAEVLCGSLAESSDLKHFVLLRHRLWRRLRRKNVRLSATHFRDSLPRPRVQTWSRIHLQKLRPVYEVQKGVNTCRRGRRLSYPEPDESNPTIFTSKSSKPLYLPVRATCPPIDNAVSCPFAPRRSYSANVTKEDVNCK